MQTPSARTPNIFLVGTCYFFHFVHFHSLGCTTYLEIERRTKEKQIKVYKMEAFCTTVEATEMNTASQESAQCGNNTENFVQ